MCKITVFGLPPPQIFVNINSKYKDLFEKNLKYWKCKIFLVVCLNLKFNTERKEI